ncbi:hypothetical protein [Carnobacterium iners]|uniref:hypothetical protein n=1 Tax=Carnobacterium iners TaxID=1073423 RepID=UPI000A1CC6C5|nr:hypothetical protein [Carnobacterium iners]
MAINDGSSDKYQSIFIELSKRKAVTVHRDIINLGKIRALKNRLDYFMNIVEQSDFSGFMTTDPDEQPAYQTS